MDLTGALETIWELVRRLNRYVEERAPWKQAKAQNSEGLDATLRDLTEGLRLLAVLLHPYMPATADEILRRLGLEPGRDTYSWAETTWGGLPDGLRAVSYTHLTLP